MRARVCVCDVCDVKAAGFKLSFVRESADVTNSRRSRATWSSSSVPLDAAMTSWLRKKCSITLRSVLVILTASAVASYHSGECDEGAALLKLTLA